MIASEAPRFELGREIGAGAVGRVFKAVLLDAWRDHPAGSELAVKFLHPQLAHDPHARRSFDREIEVGRSVQHPSLVRHVHAGELDQGRYLAMEYVPGRSLRDALLDDGDLPEPLVRSAGAGLAGGLAALHAAGWVHADVKPENARLDARGKAVLMDFGFVQRAPASKRAGKQAAEGAAKPAPELAHSEGVNPGSLAYLAPERARGLPCTGASDVFALGLVLYELVTGRHAFAQEDSGGEFGASGFSSERPLRRSLETPGADLMLAAIANARYVPPSRIVPRVSPFLDELLQDLLRRSPRERPSAAEVAQRLIEGEAGAWWRARIRSSAAADGASFHELEETHLLPLVGRDRERDAILAHYERAVTDGPERRGGVVWLSGASGSGKSRLTGDCAARARLGARPPLYLYGRCSQFEEERPCAPILRLLERYLRLASGVPPRQRERAALDELVPGRVVATLVDALDPRVRGATDVSVPDALAQWLVALGRRSPLFVFLDDVNFADEGTLDVLARVGRKLASMQALFVLGLRAHEDENNPQGLAHLRERLNTQVESVEVALAPLDEAAVQELATDVFHHSSPRLRIGQILWERSRGNAGLLAEIVRGLIERGEAHRFGPDDQKLVLTVAPERLPLPDSLQTLIRERFEKLDALERDCLQRLSVVGGRIEHDFLLRAFPDLDEAALDGNLARLVHTGWLVPVGDRYRFERPALREAVYRSLDEELRTRWHSRAADALAPVERPSVEANSPGKAAPQRRISIADALQRAFHLRSAQRHGDLLRILRPLVQVLPRRGQTQRVYVLARWGLDALDALPQNKARRRARIEFLEAAADAADRLGYRSEQRTWLDHLSDLQFDPEQDPESLARVYVLHGRYAVSTGQYGLARGMLRNAVELAERAKSGQLQSEALRRLSAVQAHVGELAEARKFVERAIEVAEHDPQRAVGSLQLGVIDLLENDLEAALQNANKALSLQNDARRWHLPGILAAGYMLRGRIYRVLGEPARALGSMQRAARLAREAGERRLEMEATARLGGLLLDLSQPEEAETRLREALLIANEIEDRRGQTLAGVWLGTLLWEQANPQAAPLLERASQLASEMGLARAEALALSLRARIAHESGDLERANQLSERALALIRHQGAELPDRIVVTGTRALVLHALDRGEEAKELIKELRERMRKDNARLKRERSQRSHRDATTRLLEAVLSPEGVIYPRVELVPRGA